MGKLYRKIVKKNIVFAKTMAKRNKVPEMQAFYLFVKVRKIRTSYFAAYALQTS